MEATDENIFIVKQETEEIAHENGNNTCDNTDKVINLSENNVQIKQELFETGPDVYNDNNINSEWSGVSVPNFIIVDTIKVEFEADTEDNAEATQRSGQQSDGELLVPDMEIHFKEENKMCSPKETIKVEVEFSGHNTETAVESSDDEEDDIKSCSNYQTNCARVAGFVEAKSINLPRIDALMVGKYLSSNSKLIPGDIKMSLSANESYGDDAVGHVQLRRIKQTCTLKCTICPEHKVRLKPFSVTLVVDEEKDDVVTVECQDCSPQTICKHSIACLMWCHRRSEEQSSSSEDCYWKESVVAKLGTSTTKTIKEMLKTKNRNVIPSDYSLVKEFLVEGKKRKLTSPFFKYQKDFVAEDINKLSLHNLMIEIDSNNDCEIFLREIANVFDDDSIRIAEIETRNSQNSELWYELCYGRITAAKCFDVIQSKTIDETLIASILDAKSAETYSTMKRNKFKDDVRKTLEKSLGNKIEKCGIFISKTHPMIAGMPDGILKGGTLIAIECPSSKKDEANYIKDDNITEHYYAKVQIQLYCANLKDSMFCVASSSFESDVFVNIFEVAYDESYVTGLLETVSSVWKKYIFPVVYRSAKS